MTLSVGNHLHKLKEDWSTPERQVLHELSDNEIHVQYEIIAIATESWHPDIESGEEVILARLKRVK